MLQSIPAIETSLGDMDPLLKQQVIEELKNAHLNEMVQSGLNHARIAREHHSTSYKSIEGLGQNTLNVDGTHYWKCVHEHGKDCWGDDDFIDYVKKIHPELRPHSTGTRIQVGFGTCGEKRSTTKYNL